MVMVRKPLVGKRFGRWLVLPEFEVRGTNHYLLCLCDCGKRGWVQRSNLVSGHSCSCGCLARELQSKAKRKYDTPPAVNRIVYTYRYSARKRKIEWRLGHAQATALLLQPCTYCGIAPSREVHSTIGEVSLVSGIDRKDNSIGYTVDNCVPCCADCNMAKLDMTQDKWNSWIKRLIAYQTSKSPQ